MLYKEIHTSKVKNNFSLYLLVLILKEIDPARYMEKALAILFVSIELAFALDTPN